VKRGCHSSSPTSRDLGPVSARCQSDLSVKPRGKDERLSECARRRGDHRKERVPLEGKNIRRRIHSIRNKAMGDRRHHDKGERSWRGGGRRQMREGMGTIGSRSD